MGGAPGVALKQHNMGTNEWDEWLHRTAEEEERREHFSSLGKKGGRPRKDVKRTERIEIRLTKEERDSIAEHAKSFNLTPSEFLRQLGQGIRPVEISDNEIKMIETLIEYKTSFKRIASMYHNYVEWVHVAELAEKTAEEIKHWIYDWQREHGKRQRQGHRLRLQ